MRVAAQIKNDYVKRKDLIKIILIKELSKTYKYAEAVTTTP